MIKAHETYTGRTLQVSGVVEHRGLQGMNHASASMSGPFSVTVDRVRETYAYVLLLPHEAERGRLLCYFDPYDRAQAGELEPGQQVTLTGIFNRYRQEPVGLVVQFDACQVEQ